MRVPGPLVACLLLLAMALAGCAGKAASSSSSSQPSSVVEATGSSFEGSGSIEGVVVDDTQSPIAGVDVEIVKTELKATTDAAGTFSFTKLAAGTYEVGAQKLGYESGLK